MRYPPFWKKTGLRDKRVEGLLPLFFTTLYSRQICFRTTLLWCCPTHNRKHVNINFPEETHWQTRPLPVWGTFV